MQVHFANEWLVVSKLLTAAFWEALESDRERVVGVQTPPC
jgi:hypothetical protein